MGDTRRKQCTKVFQLKVTIRDIRPPVWRRIRVSGRITFYRLHKIIQDLFAWEDYHLHEFILSGVHYGDPADYAEMEPDYEHRDETRHTLGRILKKEKETFEYIYDYGDYWRHGIVVEKIEYADSTESLPVCLAGRRSGPPEDCGGPWGYAEFLEAIRDPEHERHEEFTNWIGGSFDPEALTLAEVNRAIKVKRPLRDHDMEWIQ